IMFQFGGFLLKWVETHEFPFKKQLFPEDDLQSTLNWFSKRKILVIIFSRFSAGIRFFVSIVAGMTGIPLWQFISYFTIAVILWCGLLIGGGFYLGKNWEMILEVMSIYNRIIFGILVGIGLLILYFRMKKISVKKA
ncbi:MAG: VTT domain-containing protein, partial [Leptospira sp.]|nr:VTT domain-containing protein [Leptospira sp.]